MQSESKYQRSTYTMTGSPCKNASLQFTESEGNDLVISHLEKVTPEEREGNDLPYSYSELQGLSSQEDSQDLLIRLHQESVNILKQVYCKKRDLGLEKQRLTKLKEEKYSLQLQLAQKKQKSRIDEYQRRNTIENKMMRLRNQIDAQQMKIGCLRENLQLLKEINSNKMEEDPMQQLNEFNKTMEAEHQRLASANTHKIEHLLQLQEIMFQNIESLYNEFPTSLE